MRISDWSSDVCSSDLIGRRNHQSMSAGRSPSIDVAMPPYRDGAIPCSKGGRERIRLFRVQPARGTLRSKTGAAVSKDVRRWSLVGLPFPAPPLSRSYRKFRHVIVSRYVEAGDALQAFDK